MPAAVYLVDVGCFRPPDELHIDMDELDRNGSWRKQFARLGATEEEILSNSDFQLRVFAKSGLSRKLTSAPRSIHPILSAGDPKLDLNTAAAECRMTTGGAIRSVLAKTGLLPSDIDILVTTCSIYNPTPSMASMVVSEFGMRSDIQSYHLGGMGCSNGVVAINLVRDMLIARPSCNALLVTTETLTTAFYNGMDKHRLVTNTLFRMGAAAVLLSNKERWRSSGRAKYVLCHNVRVHTGARPEANKCIWYGPDDKGVVGTYLGTDVVKEASRALTQAMTKIGPYALSWTQIAKLGVNYLHRQVRAKVPAYAPKFSDGIDKFLVHAGGAKVLDGISAALRLDERYMVPSRAVLHDYGNISSSTTWYTMAFVESCQGVKRGDRVLQVGVGSGLKCGVNIWKALRDVDDVHEVWAHRGEAARVRTRAPSSSVLTSLQFVLSLAILTCALLAALYRLMTPML
ncbi:MAG: hypothetical protein WDW36_006135 [Sanguina aurantia]